MNPQALRVTPLRVLSDIDAAVRRYEALGFGRVETGDSGCVGMRAGATALILVSTASMAADFDPVLVDGLVGRPVSYIHVASLPAAERSLTPAARRLQDVRTRYGTRELLVEDAGELFILAERLDASRPDAP